MGHISTLLLAWILAFQNVQAQAPTATIVSPGTVFCTSSSYSPSYTFSANTTNTPTSFNWNVTPSTSVTILPNIISPSITLQFGKSGMYSLSLTVSNGSGSVTTSTTFSVTQSAHASFNASLNTVGYPSQMNLTNYSTFTTGVQWFFNDATSDNNPNTVKTYTSSGKDTITLVALGKNGCNDKSTYGFVIPNNSEILVPNIFTPNNDSINDIFKPISKGILKMNVYIYDRFGTPVYSWERPQGFWDGRNTAGEPLSSGVYFYVLEAAGFDGKSYKLKGNLTLLR